MMSCHLTENNRSLWTGCAAVVLFLCLGYHGDAFGHENFSSSPKATSCIRRDDSRGGGHDYYGFYNWFKNICGERVCEARFDVLLYRCTNQVNGTGCESDGWLVPGHDEVQEHCFDPYEIKLLRRDYRSGFECGYHQWDINFKPHGCTDHGSCWRMSEGWGSSGQKPGPPSYYGPQTPQNSTCGSTPEPPPTGCPGSEPYCACGRARCIGNSWVTHGYCWQRNRCGTCDPQNPACCPGDAPRGCGKAETEGYRYCGQERCVNHAWNRDECHSIPTGPDYCCPGETRDCPDGCGRQKCDPATNRWISDPQNPCGARNKCGKCPGEQGYEGPNPDCCSIGEQAQCGSGDCLDGLCCGKKTCTQQMVSGQLQFTWDTHLCSGPPVQCPTLTCDYGPLCTHEPANPLQWIWQCGSPTPPATLNCDTSCERLDCKTTATGLEWSCQKVPGRENCCQTNIPNCLYDHCSLQCITGFWECVRLGYDQSGRPACPDVSSTARAAAAAQNGDGAKGDDGGCSVGTSDIRSIPPLPMLLVGLFAAFILRRNRKRS